MVQSQVLGAISIAAVLAGEVISKVDVFTAKPDYAVGPGAHIAFKPHDAWYLKATANRAREYIVIFNDFDFALEPENQCLLPAHNFHWFVASI